MIFATPLDHVYLLYYFWWNAFYFDSLFVFVAFVFLHFTLEIQFEKRLALMAFDWLSRATLCGCCTTPELQLQTTVETSCVPFGPRFLWCLCGFFIEICLISLMCVCLTSLPSLPSFTTYCTCCEFLVLCVALSVGSDEASVTMQRFRVETYNKFALQDTLSEVCSQ